MKLVRFMPIIILGLILFACTKKGSVLSIEGSTSSQSTAFSNPAACPSFSTPNQSYYSTLSQCQQVGGANCAIIVVTAGASSYACYYVNNAATPTPTAAQGYASSFCACANPKSVAPNTQICPNWPPMPGNLDGVYDGHASTWCPCLGQMGVNTVCPH